MNRDPNHMPNLLTLVSTFMAIGGQTVNTFNAAQATLYIGLVLEEVAEMLKSVASGCLTEATEAVMLGHAKYVNDLANEFKAGMHRGDVLRSDRVKLLDDAGDTAWVAAGLMLSMANDAGGALAEIGRANHDKYVNGVAIRDANGKIQKPVMWRGPDLMPFISQPVD